MHGNLQTVRAVAREISRPSGRATDEDADRVVGSVLTDIAKTLWPNNTAPHLAAQIGRARGKPCAVRSAERYLGGQREWSGDAIAAIVSEILRRHSMRNVKVVPKR